MSGRRTATQGTKVFIGHGRSLVWFQLKDFLEKRLQLDCEEFNSEAVAGRSTVDRLKEMLDRAWFAFLVMTGEDVHDDGEAHARENVIHEAGLFQGLLGFERAIILLEEGCKEFSNIHGLTTIRFPKGNVAPKFEEIRQVLERESAKPGNFTSGPNAEPPNVIAVPGSALKLDPEREDQQRVEDEIRYLSDDEREIIAYLLAHSQRMFTNTLDCGRATTLVSKGIVVLALRNGQHASDNQIPFEIPLHVWKVLKRHEGEFPYTPPRPGSRQPHPWRRHWMA